MDIAYCRMCYKAILSWFLWV